MMQLGMNPIIEVLNIGRFVILQKYKMDGEDMLRQVFSSFSFGKNENIEWINER